MIRHDYTFEKIKEYSNKTLKREIYDSKNLGLYSSCPHCSSKNFIKFGKYDGIQRYRCKDCRKTFSNTTNSIWEYSKNPAEKWFKFTELLIEEKTLKYCAEKLDISIATAFYWRHKLLHALEKNYEEDNFKNIVFINSNTQGISNKGSKGKAYEYKNKFCKRYDLYRTRVSLIILCDTNDCMSIKVMGLSNNIGKDYTEKLFLKIDEKAYVKTIDGRTFRDYVIMHNKKLPLKLRKSFEYNPNSYYLSDNIICSKEILNCSSNLTNWLGKFKGVASKYLNHYCSLFSLSFIKKQYDYMKVFFDLLSNNFQENHYGSYYLRINQLKNMHEIEFDS